MLQLEKVATPATAAVGWQSRLACAAPVPDEIDSVTVAVLSATTVPAESLIFTTGCDPNAAPPVAALGTVQSKVNWEATPASALAAGAVAIPAMTKAVTATTATGRRPPSDSRRSKDRVDEACIFDRPSAELNVRGPQARWRPVDRG